MTDRRLFGVETEYAVTAVTQDGAVLPPLELGAALLRAARDTVPNLPSTCGGGVFIGNGSRLYVDSGSHPEIAGPECLDPWEAVRYLRAGDRLLQRLAGIVGRRNPHLAEARLFAGNTDYSGSGASWGSHESYCHRAPPAVVQRQLIPHLVARVIFCGAGGFNPLSRGVVFTLSPRAHALTRIASEASTQGRGIVNTRRESLAGRGYHRQHLICGENLRSDLAMWLRLGTTALVVAMIDGGVACGADVELARPLEALRAVAGDVTCRRALRLVGGGTATAIEIQRHYLAQARAHLRAPFMPWWAGAVCDQWSDVLVRLDRGPEHVSTTLDWAIKLAVYRDRAHRRGVPWKSLPVWSRALHAAERAGMPDHFPSARRLMSRRRTDDRWQTVRRLTPALRTVGGRLEDIDAIRRLGRELFELDTRWGLLGAGGLFHELDRAGVLTHRVPGVDRIEDAIEQPPAMGRARVRGTVIQRVWKDRNRYACGWDHVRDYGTNTRLNLSDPWTDREHWLKAPADRASEWTEISAEVFAVASEEASLLRDVRRLLRRLRLRSMGSRTPESSGS